MATISLVTGADGNLGRAVVAALKARGDTVIATALHAQALEAAFPGGDVQLLAGDLTQAEDARRVVEAALKAHGRIDALCHLAGGFAMGPAVHETADADWSHLFALNVDSLRHVAAAVVPAMRKAGRGTIVTVGANAAQRGGAGMGAYSAAKAVVQRLTESMAAELKNDDIRVNSVLPSILDTPQNRSAMPDANPADWVHPDDLAQVIAFLSSDASRAIYGAAIPVTGKV